MFKPKFQPVIGKVTSRFGDRKNPITKKIEFHNGVDISCPVGTDITCPLDGVVVKSDSLLNSNDKGGLEMKVDHGSYITGYAHLSKINYNVGDKVKAGDIICKSGNTGIGTAPHLHYTLTNPQGVKIDPQIYFTFKKKLWED